MGKIFSKLFGGGGGGKQPKQQAAAPAAAAAASKKLFTPEQITKVTGDYGKQGQAKWNQIMAGMGAGGGTGGDLSSAIQNQATQLGSSLGDLTDQSGYGADGMGQLSQIIKGVEGGGGYKYPVY
jgi:hypothetical protein